MGWFSRINAVPKVARIASGKRVYAVGDIHGRNDLLERLLKQILEDAALAPAIEKILIFLGDYVDRGPASKAVLDTLSNLKWPDWKIVFLRGNHDQAVLDFFQDSNSYRGWRSYGAAETLLSYGVLPPRLEREADFDKAKQELAQRLPQSHLEFLKGLQYFHIVDDYMFVHAGIRPGIPINEQLPEDLMWIREEFLNSRSDLPKRVVHGHTPSEKPIQARNHIGVDTGAHATHCLTAAVLEDDRCTFLQTTRMSRAELIAETGGI